MFENCDSEPKAWPVSMRWAAMRFTMVCWRPRWLGSEIFQAVRVFAAGFGPPFPLPILSSRRGRLAAQVDEVPMDGGAQAWWAWSVRNTAFLLRSLRCARRLRMRPVCSRSDLFSGLSDLFASRSDLFSAVPWPVKATPNSSHVRGRPGGT
jgi:hypothetical protein